MEAMQDVFVQVLRHRDRLDDRAPSSLLFRIATNVCLNRIRTRHRRPETADSELLWRLATHDDLERRSTAKRVLARLFGNEPESTAAIAVLHLIDGMTLNEVAREVGLSVSGVRKRLRRLQGQFAAASEVA